jgi:hypothetical protein
MPLQSTAQNQVWLEIVQIAHDLLAWMRHITDGIDRLAFLPDLG